MIILAINTKKEMISLLPNSSFDHIPNKGDSISFNEKNYKVISRYFQYRNDDLEIVNIYVRPLKWWDFLNL